MLDQPTRTIQECFTDVENPHRTHKQRGRVTLAGEPPTLLCLPLGKGRDQKMGKGLHRQR